MEACIPVGAKVISDLAAWGCCIIVGRTYQGVVTLVLPANLVNGVLEGLHNTLVGGHMGERKTLGKNSCPFLFGRVREKRWNNGAGVVMFVSPGNLHLTRRELQWKSVKH